MTEARCLRCGAAVTPGARYCMSCGADVSGEQSSVATRMVGGDTEERPVPQPRLSQADLLSLLRDDTLGDYEILAELGRGGMATVYLAHDIQLDRKVAIKVLNPAIAVGEGMVERFRLEARTAAKLSHPHIIPIHAVRETDQLVYFVMKFVVGRGLDAVLKELAPLPIPTVRTILTKVAEALGYAHRHGVIHRDIKPSNIMIDSEGMPIVTDFGIAKVTDRERLTQTGAALGTPTYMSPEQCSAGTITGASDQYSLGVMAYEMVTGRTLYEGESLVTVMYKHCHEPPPTPGDFGPNVPADLAKVIIRMLQKAPNDRWPAMEDALPALRGTDASMDDAVRTQMIEFAKGGTNASLLARVSTPRSPMPAVVPRGRSASAPTQRLPGPGHGRRSRWWLAALVVVTVAAAGALVALRPWERAAPPIEPAQATALPAESASTVPASDTAAELTAQDTAPAPVVSATPAPATRDEPTPPAAPMVRDVRITGAPPTLAEGQTVRLQAEVLDQRGRPLARTVAWTSSDPAVATVGGDGGVQALAPGQATLRAAVEGHSAEVALTVAAVVASVEVTPAADTVAPGQALPLAASPRDRQGRPLADRTVTWQSSDERVAVVSSSGRVTALAAGTVVIRATSDGRTGAARVTVAAPPASRPAEPPPVVENPQEAITGLVQAYAHALETKNITQVKALYPELDGAQERRTREALNAMEELHVRIAPAAITVDGSRATARVTGAWTYRGGRLDINNRYTFERRASGWVIVAID